ncbi:hypothetical protein WI89_08105 [Burkholderia ubonensis]|nr:H-NS histone family protein [Burkholderia ubonensis]KVD75508.1 hypothetical protein WI89_08105 [Burkholderia ubonensis]
MMSQLAELKSGIDSARDEEVRYVIEQVMAVLSESGINLDDLASYVQANKRGKRHVAPKYWNPETGETWSGRGKLPRWLVGLDRSLYLLPDPSALTREQAAESGPEGRPEQPPRPSESD